MATLKVTIELPSQPDTKLVEIAWKGVYLRSIEAAPSLTITSGTFFHLKVSDYWGDCP